MTEARSADGTLHCNYECTLLLAHAFLSAHFSERTLFLAHAFPSLVLTHALTSARFSDSILFPIARFSNRTIFRAHTFRAHANREHALRAQAFPIARFFERTLYKSHHFSELLLFQLHAYPSARFSEHLRLGEKLLITRSLRSLVILLFLVGGIENISRLMKLSITKPSTK